MLLSNVLNLICLSLYSSCLKIYLLLHAPNINVLWEKKCTCVFQWFGFYKPALVCSNGLGFTNQCLCVLVVWVLQTSACVFQWFGFYKPALVCSSGLGFTNQHLYVPVVWVLQARAGKGGAGYRSDQALDRRKFVLSCS